MNEEEKESIEEFRKQLRLAINIDDVTTAIRNDNAQTILNLIEKLQKENESWKSYSEELEGKNTEISNKKCELEFEVEKLQKENEELKLYNNSITSELEQMTTEKFKNGWFHQSEFKGFIPVQKVKDKIEEYKNMLKTCNKVKDIDRIKAINERILELEELLEGRK